jgi:hypothetical protein
MQGPSERVRNRSERVTQFAVWAARWILMEKGGLSKVLTDPFTFKWVAARLQMGTSKSAKPMLYDWMRTNGKRPENTEPYGQLRFQPPVC